VSFVTLEDINVHLGETLLQALDADDDPSVLDAERIIKGKLSGTFSPTVIASWVSPATTPETIRAIAGRFVAALYYARAYSEEQTQTPEYAQKLYDEAMSMLQCIVDGDIILPEVADVDQPTTGGNLESADFLPNDSTSPGSLFSVSEVW
jgi:hypothetical protein